MINGFIFETSPNDLCDKCIALSRGKLSIVDIYMYLMTHTIKEDKNHLFFLIM